MMNDPAFTALPYDLPDDLPIFPLTGVLLLPRGQLPLNVFENRYKAMVDDALRSDRLIGIIQPRTTGLLTGDDLFTTGCAGRITSFTETDDGRYEIALKGVCRFHVASEKPLSPGGYRRVTADWSAFRRDTESVGALNIDRDKLKALLKSYFFIEGMNCNWHTVDGASDDTLITCLSMICPLDAGEKQALLEASCGNARADLFMTLLEMAIRDGSRAQPAGSPCH